jgi:hypothetical protein
LNTVTLEIHPEMPLTRRRFIAQSKQLRMVKALSGLSDFKPAYAQNQSRRQMLPEQL